MKVPRTLVKCYPKTRNKTVVIPNGVDTLKYAPNQNARKTTRIEIGICESDMAVIFIGDEFAREGLRSAVDALAKLAPKFHLIVVGGKQGCVSENYPRRAINQGCGERVHFLGSRSDTPSLINVADALILPSSFEAWPLVGLEAMACAKPVLMTAVGGIPEYLEPGKNGYFIERDADDIAEKTRCLLEDPETTQKFSAHARETAEKYSWSLVAEPYIKLVQEIAKEKEKRA